MITIVSVVAAAAAVVLVVHDVTVVSVPVAMISVQTDRAVDTVQVRRAVVSVLHRAVDQADSDVAAHSVTVEVHMVATALAPVVLAHAMVCAVLEAAVVVAVVVVSTGTQVVVVVAVDSDQDRHVVASKQTHYALSVYSQQQQQTKPSKKKDTREYFISTFYQMKKKCTRKI